MGFVTLVRTKLLKQSVGTTYIMLPPQLHKINHNTNEMVATIMCTEPTDNLYNRLIPSVKIPQLQPQFLSANELRMAITLFLLNQI